MSVLIRIEEMLKKTELSKAQGDHEDTIQTQLNEHCNLLQYLMKIYKKLEDQRTIVEERNVKLICENQALFTRLEKNKHKYDELGKKYKKLTENFEIILKLQDECNSLSDIIKKRNTDDINPLENVNELLTNDKKELKEVPKKNEIENLKKLCIFSDAYSQTDSIGDSILVFDNNSLETETDLELFKQNQTDVILSKEDFAQLEENMLMLREVLEKREESWLKITEKEREHRSIVMKLKNELSQMRQAATFNREELEKKSLKYKDLYKENKSLYSQINRLKKDLNRLKKPEPINQFKSNYISPYKYGTSNTSTTNRGHFYSGFSCGERQLQPTCRRLINTHTTRKKNSTSKQRLKEKLIIQNAKIEYEGPESFIENEKGTPVHTQIQRHICSVSNKI